VAVGNDRQFGLLCRAVLERPDLAEDPRFAANAARVTHREALLEILKPALARRLTADWLDRLRAAGIPAGAVRGVGAALGSPEAIARDMVAEVSHPTAGRISLVASPLKLTGTPVQAPVAPPLLGQHTDQVLGERLGLDPERIAELRAAGAIG
jgi:crotonobetainyl-CoA:carnitine CoA-transferase CaiB-like acyl-CoA transferase